jgi:hypothetical protein
MNTKEAETQAGRIEKFRELQAVRDKTVWALDAITKSDPTGPCGQGPFTGNTRESRQVKCLRMSFTQTRGGSPPVEISIDDLFVEASELGRELQRMLRARLERIEKEMSEV